MVGDRGLGEVEDGEWMDVGVDGRLGVMDDGVKTYSHHRT